MPRGGNGPNWHPGLVKRTREIAEWVAATGKTPLEVMLEAMKFYYDLHHNPEASASARKGAIDKAADFARDAAPYMHPKLASVEHSAKNGNGSNARTFTITIGNAQVGEVEHQKREHLNS